MRDTHPECADMQTHIPKNKNKKIQQHKHIQECRDIFEAFAPVAHVDIQDVRGDEEARGNVRFEKAWGARLCVAHMLDRRQRVGGKEIKLKIRELYANICEITEETLMKSIQIQKRHFCKVYSYRRDIYRRYKKQNIELAYIHTIETPPPPLQHTHTHTHSQIRGRKFVLAESSAVAARGTPARGAAAAPAELQSCAE